MDFFHFVLTLAVAALLWIVWLGKKAYDALATEINRLRLTVADIKVQPRAAPPIPTPPPFTKKPEYNTEIHPILVTPAPMFIPSPFGLQSIDCCTITGSSAFCNTTWDTKNATPLFNPIMCVTTTPIEEDEDYDDEEGCALDNFYNRAVRDIKEAEDRRVLEILDKKVKSEKKIKRKSDKKRGKKKSKSRK